MKPKSYKTQSACKNCAHCFTHEEYDSGNLYYCAFYLPERPFCGSTFMDEMFDWRNKKKYNRQIREWDNWEDGREVFPEGKCDEWTKRGKSV